MSKEADKFEQLLAAIGRQARAQERAGRIPPPKVTRARRRGPTRQELAQAIAMADAYLLAHGRLSSTARSALQGAQVRRAMRQPAGDFSQPQPYQPTPDQQAMLDQLYQGQRQGYLASHPIRGDQGRFEPRTWQSWVAQALAPLAMFQLTEGAALAAARGLTKADMRQQLLDLSYVPSPPEAGRYPWTLLNDAELADVQRRLYGPGGPVTQRMATAVR